MGETLEEIEINRTAKSVEHRLTRIEITQYFMGGIVGLLTLHSFGINLIASGVLTIFGTGATKLVSDVIAFRWI